MYSLPLLLILGGCLLFYGAAHRKAPGLSFPWEKTLKSKRRPTQLTASLLLLTGSGLNVYFLQWGAGLLLSVTILMCCFSLFLWYFPLFKNRIPGVLFLAFLPLIEIAYACCS